ncbi:hypothetical protein L3049_03120 [Labilibaculum sp. DW002]|uniref:Type II secretion system protein n=1 Tax=Paralabilibaculum antarcticum TaxID=2912572 RepID=A0ABT5VNY7_9BACT|nr:hypothetical protein [Labilibaculum sp. DW002]MDE5416986.1 hypothetical protein [Labilibaculum sp. DW002]
MNSKRGKIKTYLIELTIVTIGVLIALFLSNLKEYDQARKYHIASIETINSEIKSNYSSLNGIVEDQTNLLDTLIKYTEDSSTIVDLFKQSNGLQYATIHNSGLEFYKRNQINSIDFEMMSTLINMNFLSEIIDKKLDKFSEFIYSNAFSNSKESKMVVILHLQDILYSENQLMEYYKDFIDKNIETENDSE